MPFHYRIINTHGTIVMTSEGTRLVYGSRVEAKAAGEIARLINGYTTKSNKVTVVPAEENNEQTKS